MSLKLSRDPQPTLGVFLVAPRVQRSVAVAAVVALAARLAWVLATTSGHLTFDKYFFLGGRLAAQGWVPGVAFTSSPLYTYLVGFLSMAWGFTETHLRLLQAVVGAATVLLAGCLTHRLAGFRAAAVTAFVLALYPSLILYDTEPLTVVWENLCNVLLLWFLLRSRATGGRRDAALAGGCLGLSALLRPNILLLGVPLLLWLSVRRLVEREPGLATAASRRARLEPLAWFAAAAALVISPVAWMNTRADGGLVLVTASGGSTFYGGNNRLTDGLFFQPPLANIQMQLLTPVDAIRDVITAEHLGFRTIAGQIMGREVSAREASDFWRDETLAWARREPKRFAGLMAAKLGFFFNAYEQHDIGSAYTRGEPLRAVQTAAFALVWPIGLLGLVLAVREWRRWFPVLGLFTVFLATTVAFYVNARLRLPAVLPLALAAGLAVDRLVTWFRAGRKRALAASAAGLLAAGALCLLPSDRTRAGLARSRAHLLYFQHGWQAAIEGRTGEAAAAFTDAITENPEIAGSVLTVIGQLVPSPAWEQVRRAAAGAGAAVESSRGDRERETAALLREAYSLMIVRRPADAAEVFGRAAARDSGDPEPVYGQANALATLGRWNEALAGYERAFELGRKFESGLDALYLDMGRVAIQAGDRVKAVDYLRRALFVKPDLVEARRLLDLLSPS